MCLYILSFDTELPPAQAVQLAEKKTEQIITLSSGKFHNVDSITLFIVDNYGAPYTSIMGLQLYGIGVHTTDVSKIKSLDS